MTFFGKDKFGCRVDARLSSLEGRTGHAERDVAKLDNLSRGYATRLVGLELDVAGLKSVLAELQKAVAKLECRPKPLFVTPGERFFGEAYAEQNLGELERRVMKRVQELSDKLKVIEDREARHDMSTVKVINNHSTRLCDQLNRIVKLEEQATDQQGILKTDGERLNNHFGTLTEHGVRLKNLEQRTAPAQTQAVDPAVPGSSGTVACCAPVVPCDQELFNRFYEYVKKYHPVVAVQKTATLYGLNVFEVRAAIKRYAEL